MRSFYFAVIIIATLTIFAEAGFAQRRSLSGSEWRLTELNGETIRSTRAELEIADNGRRFTGNAGCNRMFGSLQAGPKSIRFTGIGTTRMYCPGAAIARREHNLLAALRRATRYRISGDELTILAGTRTLARFVSRRETGGSPTRAALDDRKWILDAVGGKPLPKVQDEPFIVFDAAKGSAGGNTSCNVFGGSYTASGDSIRITEVVSTMRACIEDARMDVERRFLDGLRRADRFEIRGGRLILYRGQDQLLGFAGRSKV